MSAKLTRSPTLLVKQPYCTVEGGVNMFILLAICDIRIILFCVKYCSFEVDIVTSLRICSISIIFSVILLRFPHSVVTILVMSLEKIRSCPNKQRVSVTYPYHMLYLLAFEIVSNRTVKFDS